MIELPQAIEYRCGLCYQDVACCFLVLKNLSYLLFFKDSDTSFEACGHPTGDSFACQEPDQLLAVVDRKL